MAKSKRDEYLGKVYVNNQGLKMTIVEYENSANVTVRFEDGMVRKTDTSTLKIGSIRHPNYALNNREENRTKYLGKVYMNNQGLKMKVIEYIDSQNVIVQFEDGHKKKATIANIINGLVNNKNFRHPNNGYANYIGRTFEMNDGSILKIIGYENRCNVTVEYDDGYKAITDLSRVLKRNAFNPFKPSVENVGYIGVGKYSSAVDGARQKEYSVWVNMLRRCYNKEHQAKYPSYIGCTVDEKWHNFQNFAEWYNKEYYDIGESLEVDKDFKIKGNSIYKDKNCLLIPSRINKIARHRKTLEYNHSIGVRCEEYEGVIYGYSAAVQIYNSKNRGKLKHLGTFDTPEQAFQAYKQAKEAYIQQAANEYKQKYGDKFPDKVYKALMNYRVEITD